MRKSRIVKLKKEGCFSADEEKLTGINELIAKGAKVKDSTDAKEMIYSN